ncbi:hypothetical protein ACQPUY_15415 [Clostridium nigeriense]|uniref:hypothetical protein n=1 Tax=Clostridium nigeriense TaxID=1805470 RepID=UPI003D350771
MIKKLEEEVISKFKIKYEQLINKDFNDFYSGLAIQLNQLYYSMDKDLVIKNLKYNNIRMTKIRWVKKILTDKNSSIKKEIDSAKLHYQKVSSKEMSIEKFEAFYGAKNIDEYILSKTKYLEEWKSNEHALLTEFQYISSLSKRSITAAFKNDILLFFVTKCKEEEIKNKTVTLIPSILSDIPIDTTSRIDFLSDEQKKSLEESPDIINPSTIDKLIMIGEEDQDKILMQLEKMTYLEIKRGARADKFLDMMTQIALLKSVKYLNSVDVNIIRYYYTHLEKMVLGEPIDKTIYQIVTDLGMPNTLQYYELVENSIAKLGSMNLSYDIEGNSIHGNLLGCMIYEDGGTKKATVYLGPILQAVVLKKSTFEYDEATFNSLSSDSQQLAIWFQKRRYRSAINNQGYNDIIALGMFSTAIYWNTKRKDRQRDRILAALKELKEKNLIIKDYLYDKKIYQFSIEYIPLSPRELSKLEINNTSHSNVLKEGNYKLLEK